LFGADTASLRVIARNIENLGGDKVVEVLKKSYLIVFGTGLLMLLAFLLLKTKIQSTFGFESYYLFYLLFASICFGIVKLNAQFFRGAKKIAAYGIFEFISISFFCLLGVGFYLFFYENFRIKQLIVIYSLSVLITALVSGTAWMKISKINPKKVLNSLVNTKAKELSSFFWFSFSFLLATSVSMFSFWLAQFLLKWYHGAAEVGIYDIASRLCMFITLPLFAVTAIIAPKLSENYAKGDMANFNKVVRQGTLISLMLGSPVAIVLFLFPEFALSIFGEDFVSGALALKVLIIGYFVNMASGPLSIALQMSKHEKVFRNIVIISAFFSTITGLLLIPTYNILGAVLAYVCFVSVGSFLNILMYWKLFKRKSLS